MEMNLEDACKKNGTTVQKVQEVLQSLLDCFELPPKEFCKKYGFNKETERYLEYITEKAAEKEIEQRVTIPECLHFSLN